MLNSVYARFLPNLRYTASSETRAAGNLRVQYLNYHCESVFRQDKSNERMAIDNIIDNIIIPPDIIYDNIDYVSMVWLHVCMYVCCPPKWRPGNSCYMRVT